MLTRNSFRLAGPSASSLSIGACGGGGGGCFSLTAPIAIPAFPENGSFSRQFTGRKAQELMASWRAPFRDPLRNLDSRPFGVLVGKRQ